MESRTRRGQEIMVFFIFPPKMLYVKYNRQTVKVHELKLKYFDSYQTKTGNATSA